MHRREFGLMTASGLAVASVRPAQAQQTPDAKLLTTTLTPLGAERAGNADGSIPAWTGGLVTPPVPVNEPVNRVHFADEQPLYEVNSTNMAQYAHLLSPGTQTLISKSGLRMKVYQTHRTAAAPQYVYDNTAANVARARFVPQGGRFGFTGGYSGPPFPIPDRADPATAGAQIIWNHLVRWQSFQNYEGFAGTWVAVNGNVVETYGGASHFLCPYYDPKGSPETYDGYFTKLHEHFLAPASTSGQEAIVWTSSNVLEKPNITWITVAGQGRVRKAPDEAYDTPNPNSDGINNYDDASGFAGSPQKYDWKLIGKQEMLIGYNCAGLLTHEAQQVMQPRYPNADLVRWEKHRVWVVEATLHPGERNTTARRMIYVDEDTWTIVLTDMYDADNKMVKTAAIYLRSLSPIPCTMEAAEVFWDLETGNYAFTGNLRTPPYNSLEYLTPQSPLLFEPQQMAASSSF